tara:strand:+ start:172884 stop:173210 length:327 start_codon:yes stop_codon:yes gene_type:complete
MEELVMSWVQNQHVFKTRFLSKPVDYVHSKLFNTIDFYFSNEEDEIWYQELIKTEYKIWCEEHLDDWGEVFNKRIFYPTFISELFMTSEMVNKMLNGTNVKRIKRKFK